MTRPGHRAVDRRDSRPANVTGWRAGPFTAVAQFDRKNSVLPESLGPYGTSVPYGKNV